MFSCNFYISGEGGISSKKFKKKLIQEINIASFRDIWAALDPGTPLNQ